MSKSVTAPVLPATPRSSRFLFAVMSVGACLLAIAWGIYSRAHAHTKLRSAAEASAIQSVNVTHPKLGSEGEEIELPGNTQAFTDTPIYARTSGYLKKWYADIGAHVHAGDLLAEIEVPELDQQLDQAQFDLKSAQANMQLADLTSERWQKLLAEKAVSKQETDQYMSDAAAKGAAYASSQANVHRLQQLQNYERVTAPFDGVITARNTDIGNLIGSGTGSAGGELFHLDASQQLRVYVGVPEVYARSIRDGDKVSVTQTTALTEPITGTVVRNAGAINQSTRTLNVEVDVDNARGALLPGAYVFVHFRLASDPHAVTIPSNALLFRSEGLRAAAVRNGRVALIPITIGHDFGATVEVTSGLTAADEIVLDPSDSLAEGDKVEVNPQASSAGK